MRPKGEALGKFGNPRGVGASRSHRAVHRTVLAVDVERFGAHDRTNPDRLVVRSGLYRSLRTALQRVGIKLADCHHEDRGDGVLVLIPSDVTKSVLIERLPHELAAVLRKHNEAHGAPEQIRLRMSIHAGEIHHDAHGVVGDAVNHTYRLLDSPALKAALAKSTGVLALITSDWFFMEVVRHSTDGNAAAYQRIRVVEKETDTAAWIYLPDDQATTLSGETLPRPVNLGASTLLDTHSSQLLWAASDRSARRLGARRTAYPLDLSIAELHSRGLYVPATFSETVGSVSSCKSTTSRPRSRPGPRSSSSASQAAARASRPTRCWTESGSARPRLRRESPSFGGHSTPRRPPPISRSRCATREPREACAQSSS